MSSDSSANVFKYEQRIGPFHRMIKMRDQRGIAYVRDACSVDIIIPYHMKYDLVRKALKSVLEYTVSNPYLVTLVDDGSPGQAATEFANTIKQAPQTEYLRLENQLGFGAAVMAGIARTHQPYICVMHSDCQVRNLQWLEAMGEALIEGKRQNVRLVSSRTDNPVSCDTPEVKTSFEDMGEDTCPSCFVVDSPLPLHCCLFHRELLERIGPLKSYPYTWYEGDELFYRMKKWGFKQAVAGRSWVHHEGSATIKHLMKKDPAVEAVVQENKSRCVSDLRLLYGNR